MPVSSLTVVLSSAFTRTFAVTAKDRRRAGSGNCSPQPTASRAEARSAEAD
jgi:hypothetical protein